MTADVTRDDIHINCGANESVKMCTEEETSGNRNTFLVLG